MTVMRLILKADYPEPVERVAFNNTKILILSLVAIVLSNSNELFTIF